MRFHRNATALATATLCALGVMSVPAGTANADVGIVYTKDVKPRGGSARFFDNGDLINVCDRDADGYAAIAYIIYIENGNAYKTSNVKASGAGSCVTQSRNVPESLGVLLEVCLLKSGDFPRYCHNRNGSN